MKKKKSKAENGIVLRRINDSAHLKLWAEYLEAIDPWKTLEIKAESLLNRWTTTEFPVSFLVALNPKFAKNLDFAHENGFVVLNTENAKAVIKKVAAEKTPQALEALEDGGYISAITTKVRHKGVGKYLLTAAERIVAEKCPRIFLFVSESNTSALRFYKGQGYEEVGRVADCLKPGNIEILLTKRLMT